MTEEKNKKALITGIAGQDGSYLTELLLNKGYEVHGIIRWDSILMAQKLSHLCQDTTINGVNLFLHHGDLTDAGNIERLIQEIKPDEIYHLAAMSHVKVSFEMPEYAVNTNALGTLRILEAIRKSGLPIKFYMAASSEMFGASPPPQSENTPFYPRSPYACSKVFSYHMTKLYREAFKIPAFNGILFNHESPRRGPTFVTKKITRAIARIKAGLDKKLFLGNLEAKRDWGFAPEYVEAMWLMLNRSKPDDYVIGRGESHSVKEFVEKAFDYSGLGDWKKYVEIDSRLFRPVDVETLIGDSKKAKEKLGWNPKINFDELVKIMIDSDFRENNLTPPGEGDKIIKDRFPNRWWKED